MKKLLFGILPLLMFIMVLCGCTQEILPQPKFPLDKDTIITALEEVGLPWTISEEQSWLEGHTVFTLVNEENQMVANVSSAINREGGRVLLIGFMSPTIEFPTNSVPLLEKDWEKAFSFASLLFGGFKASNQIYEAFSKEESQAEIPDRALWKWEKEFRDIHCSANVKQVGSYISKRYLMNINALDPDGLAYYQSLMKYPEA